MVVKTRVLLRCMALNYDALCRLRNPVCSSRSRITGKERDTESGNDYFKYRYYASSMGRWLSPDPSGLSHADLGNPQSLNLYNYVGNRPLTVADLDGLCWKGFQWACDLGNDIKNLAIDAKNKIVYGEWTTNTTQAKIHSVDRHEARTRSDSYRKETDKEKQDYLNADPYANVSLPPGVIFDPFAPPPLPKLKGKDKWLCIYGPMTNEMLGGDSAPSDSSDTEPGKGGAEPIPFNTTTRGGKAVTRQMGVNEGADAKAGAVVEGLNYGPAAAACFLN